MTPFGLLMVLQTPVVSGAGAGNREIREGKKVSNIELLYQLNWAAWLLKIGNGLGSLFVTVVGGGGCGGATLGR